MNVIEEMSFDHISIIEKPPGPRALSRQQRISSLSTPFCGSFPFVFDDTGSGSGSYVQDIDGNVFLDFNSQICSNPIGYNHPDMIEALEPYLNRFPLKIAGDDFFLQEREEFQERLISIVPHPLRKVFIINSGAEAVENAIKIAYYYTQRSFGISLQGAFHGRTLGALSLTNSNIQHKQFFPSLPVRRIPFVEESATENEVEFALRQVQNLLRQDVSADEIAFLIFEPIQGEGGYRVPHPKYIHELRNITRENNIPLIADEIQTGMGRTGKMWAHQHLNIEVDLMTAGKALQVAATIGSEEVFFSNPSDACRISSTWGGGDLIGLAMGIEVMKIIDREHLVENAANKGKYLQNQLTKLAENTLDNKIIQFLKPRGKGLMIGMKVQQPGNKKRFDKNNKHIRNQFVDACYEHGLLILGAGWNNIRFAPPLNVTTESIDEAIAVIEDVVQEIEK
ncbi:MAG: aspartate aminotransferase family protein [Candidatus Thorarchaeota archaeon]